MFLFSRCISLRRFSGRGACGLFFRTKFAYFLDRKSVLHIQIAFCYVNDPCHTYKTPCFLTSARIFWRRFWLPAIKRAHVRFEGRARCQPCALWMAGNQHVLQTERARTPLSEFGVCKIKVYNYILKMKFMKILTFWHCHSGYPNFSYY